MDGWNIAHICSNAITDKSLIIREVFFPYPQLIVARRDYILLRELVIFNYVVNGQNKDIATAFQ